MIETFYYTGRPRQQFKGTLVCTRPELPSTHLPKPNLVLADIKPADGTPVVTAYIKA